MVKLKRVISLLGVLFLLTSSACLFDSSEEDQYEDSYEHKSRVVTGEIKELFDNGFRRSTNVILSPYQQSADGFYLVESPEMLDSIFSEVNYPGLETFFPNDGMLLIFTMNLFFYQEIAEHAYSFNEDTIHVDYVVRSWLDGPYEPGIWYIALPIGITLE